MKESYHFETAKALTTLFIVLIAFGIFLLFYTYRDSLLEGEGLYSFITLTVIGFSLLIGLFYLVINSKHSQVRVNKASTKKHKKPRK